MVNIGAIWEAMPMKYVYGTAAVSSAYLATILASYRADMFATRAEAASHETDKTPTIMKRASINAFMEKEEKRVEDGKMAPAGAWADRIK